MTSAVLSDSVDPTQVLAVTNEGQQIGSGAKFPSDAVLVLVLEDHGVNAPSGFPKRKAFHVPSRLGVLGGCGGLAVGTGFEFIFRDHGGDFYAFVYAARHSLAEQAVAVLNSLSVSRR